MEKNLLQPLPQRQPLPNANLKLYYKFHQAIGHDTDNYARLKYEIQDLIDSGKITVPESKKPNTQNNSLPNNRNVPPPNAPILMSNTGLT